MKLQLYAGRAPESSNQIQKGCFCRRGLLSCPTKLTLVSASMAFSLHKSLEKCSMSNWSPLAFRDPKIEVRCDYPICFKRVSTEIPSQGFICYQNLHPQSCSCTQARGCLLLTAAEHLLSRIRSATIEYFIFDISTSNSYAGAGVQERQTDDVTV